MQFFSPTSFQILTNTTFFLGFKEYSIVWVLQLIQSLTFYITLDFQFVPINVYARVFFCMDSFTFIEKFLEDCSVKQAVFNLNLHLGNIVVYSTINVSM